MAPRKPTRTVEHERYLAERIRDTRIAKGWSLEDLARRMTEAGCPMDKSAIHRIEQGSPPRRITLDEAVTFANVFAMQLNSLLLPAAVARSQEAARAWRRYLELSAKYRGVQEELTEQFRTLMALVEEGHEDEVRRALQQHVGADGTVAGSTHTPEDLVALLRHVNEPDVDDQGDEG